MPVFRVETFKSLGGERWENTHYVLAASIASAIPLAQQITDAERLFHSDQVMFTYTRTSSEGPADDQFFNAPQNVPGQSSASNTGGLLPLWNVAKLYLTKSYGRPDFKLFRGVLGETNTDSGQTSSAVRTLIIGAFAPILGADEAFYVTSDGVVLGGMSVDTLIRHRQLHRVRRKKTSGELVTP